MGNFFNNGSMTMKLHILKVLYGLESHAKDGRCGLSRNGDIRRFEGKLVKKNSKQAVRSIIHCRSSSVKCNKSLFFFLVQCVFTDFSVPDLRTSPIF